MTMALWEQYEQAPAKAGLTEQPRNYQPGGSLHQITRTKAGRVETWNDVAKAHDIANVWDLINHNFPGCNSPSKAKVVNWYLHHHWDCPLAPDGKNRMFRAGMAVYWPQIVFEEGEVITVKVYNRDKAAAFARKHAKEWKKYLINGEQVHRYLNDCTNFVSHCLLRGGWPMIGGTAEDRKNDDVWWYDKITGTNGDWWEEVKDTLDPARYLASYTWAAARNFGRFMLTSKRATAAFPKGVQTFEPGSYLRKGDVVQVSKTDAMEDIYHTTIVTTLAGKDVLVSYHSNDNLDRSLTDLMNDGFKGKYFFLWQMKDVIG